MLTNFHSTRELGRDRQREMLASARSQHAARQSRAQSRTAKSIERPMRRVRRALRAVFT
jgi:hypothetical protein